MAKPSPLKRILWASDFSADSCAALRTANAVAKGFGAPLTGLHVVPDFSPVLAELHGGAEAEMAGKVERAREEAATRLASTCRTEQIALERAIVKEGSIAKTIVATAASEKAGLIAVGRRGTAAGGGAVGSVASQVLRSSTVPVLVAPAGAGAGTVKSILVPTDFSAREDLERDWALRLAEALGASVRFLYVLELYGHEFRMIDEMLEAAIAKLRARVRRAGETIELSEDVYKAHNAAEGIVEYARDKKLDLIVMSTHVKPLARFLLGSTTNKVVGHATVPVFAIPRGK